MVNRKRVIRIVLYIVFPPYLLYRVIKAIVDILED